MAGSQLKDLDPAVLADLTCSLARIAKARGHRYQDAEDLVQEAFCRALARDDLDSPGAWLRTAVVKLTITHERILCRSRERLGPQISLESAHVAFDPRTERNRAEFHELFALAISKLPNQLRQIVHLRSEGHTYAEIGEILRLREKTIERRLHTACERIRSIFQEYLGHE